METKREKLIPLLKSVISALENDSIKYNWIKQCSCNCGVVAQAITGEVHDEMKEKYLNKHLLWLAGRKIDQTWTNLVKEYCPITGEPIAEIFRKFYDVGITREEIVHLEYLDDKKILARTDIDVNEKKMVTKSITEVTIVEIPRSKFASIFFGKTKKEEKSITRTISVPEEKSRYYQDKKNLIKYLTAWVQILHEETQKWKITDVESVVFPAKEIISTFNIITGKGIIKFANDEYEINNADELLALENKLQKEERYEDAVVVRDLIKQFSDKVPTN